VSSAVLAAGMPRRNRALAVLALGVVWVLFWYRGTALAMAEIWYRSETFNHGFVVLPISLWLVWRKRKELARLPIDSATWPLPLLALTAFGWLLGDLAGVNALMQLALVSLLVLLVATLLGNALTRALAFPLGFLFFMVPLGEFALPALMDGTAKFTVLALRLTGIPVYQEGLQFVIPSGNWSVVEACSGVRYLIASVCVGSLFAYLNYVSLKRRLLFVAVSFLVPIVANWVRAYLIVMIGHLSDGKLAAGVDHLIYGWVFFGVVIMIMFAIGARWTERPRAPQIAGTDGAAASPVALSVRPAIALLAAALIAAPHLGKLAIGPAESGRAVRLVELGELPGWQPDATPAPWQPAFGQANAASTQMFTRGAETVGVHVAYYRNQDHRRKLVSSANTLVRSDDGQWARVAAGTRQLQLNGETASVRTAELRATGGERLIVWHWYSINGRITASDYLAKLYTALDRLRGRGDDSAGIFVFAYKDAVDVDAALESFLSVAVQPIDEALRSTREQARGAQ
jgi:exosortase A